MLHFLIGPAGTGKTNTVRSRIADSVKKGKSGIILLTPEQYSFESERAVLRLLGATASDRAEVLSFTKLIEYVGEDCREFIGVRADTGIKAVALKKALLSVNSQLNIYSKTKASPEFILSLLEIINEFKQSSIDIADLIGKISVRNNKHLYDKIHDLELIISAYNSILAEKYLDPDDDLDRLNTALYDNHFFAGKTVYIDAFDGFTMQQYKIIEHIIKDSADVFVSFCTDSLHDSDMGTGLFSNVKKEIARFISIANKYGIKIAQPEIFSEYPRFKNDGLRAVEHIMRGETEMYDNPSDNVVICQAETLYDEVDYTARNIKKLVREKAYRYRDFTVIVRNMDDYRQIFESAFNRYGIPCYLDKKAENSDLMLTSYLNNVLRTAAFGFSPEYVFSMLKSPLSFMDIEDVSMLENYVYMWSIKPESWDDEWLANPDGANARMNKDSLDAINRLRSDTVKLMLPIKEAVKEGVTKNICRTLYDFMLESNVQSKIKQYAKELNSDGNLFLSELQYKSWDFAVDLFDKIVAVSDKYIKPRDLLETYEMLIKCDNIGTIPSRIDEVMIGDAYRIRPCDPKVVFVLGANYREMPKPPVNNGILSISDRALLIENGVEINDRIETDSIKERYVIYSSVCSASEHIFITYHSFNAAYEQALPSDFVNEIANHFTDFKITAEKDSRTDRFESVSSLYEYIAENNEKIEVDYERIIKPEIKQFSDTVKTVKNGIADSIKPDTAFKLVGRNIRLSPTRLEFFSKCPFAYYCKYSIKANTIEKAQINPIQRGNIAHYALEKILKKYSCDLYKQSDEQLKKDISDCANEYIEQFFKGFDTDDKHFVFTVERIKKLLFDVIRNIGNELAQSEFKPIAFEQEISPESDVKSMQIPIDEGNVTLIGTIDRVDIMRKDGKSYVRVVDYKSGKKVFALSDILYGLNMQMLLYLYSYIDAKKDEEYEPAGVLYMPVRYSEYADSMEEVDNSSYAMNGLVSSEDGIPEAMEQKAESRYIPYSYKKDGQYASSSLYSKSDFDDIKAVSVSMVKSVGNGLHKGNIARSPLNKSGECACDHCDYRSVCLSAGENMRTVKSGRSVMDTIREAAKEYETDQ